MFGLKTVKLAAAAVVIGSMTIGSAMAGGEHVAPATAFAKSTVAKWIADAQVVEAVKAQNQKNSGISQGDIDKMDKEWRAEVDASSKPMIDGVLSTAVSKFLAKVKADTGGLVTEIFVMDNHGLNVAQSDVTSDYWQGDEAKWQKTYSMGPDAIFVDDVEMDESTQTLQTQVSMSIKDPATNEVIGAITVGVNVEGL